MAIGQSSAPTAPIGIPQAQSNPSTGVVADVVPAAIGPAALFSGYATNADLSADAEKYLTDLLEVIKKSGRYADATLDRVEDIPGGWYVRVGDRGYGLLFAEACNIAFQNETPLSATLVPLVKSVQRRYPNIHITGNAILFPYDYPRVRQMGLCIANAITAASRASAKKVTAKAIAAAGNYVVDDNIDNVRAYADRNSPHAVPNRIDIGITLGVKTNQLPGSMQNPYGQGPLAAPIVDTLVSVGGFVDIVAYRVADNTNGLAAPQPVLYGQRPLDTVAGGWRFRPNLRITDVSANYYDPGLIMYALAQFVEHQGILGNWRKQFYNFAQGQPNVGNLTMDPENPTKLWKCSSPDEVNSFIAMYFDPIIISIDVAEGRHRIPFLSAFLALDYGRDSDTATKASSQILNQTAEFFDTTVTGPISPVGQLAVTEYVGTIGEVGGRMIDSRYYSYLNQVARHGVLDDSHRGLLLTYNYVGREQWPIQKARLIKSTTGNFVSIHEDFIVQLSGNWLVDISRHLAAAGLSAERAGGAGSVLALNFNLGMANLNDWTVGARVPQGQQYGHLGGINYAF